MRSTIRNHRFSRDDNRVSRMITGDTVVNICTERKADLIKKSTASITLGHMPLVDAAPECLLNYGARGMSYVTRLRAPLQQAAVPGRAVCEPLPYLRPHFTLHRLYIRVRTSITSAQVWERYPAG